MALMQRRWHTYQRGQDSPATPQQGGLAGAGRVRGGGCGKAGCVPTVKGCGDICGQASRRTSFDRRRAVAAPAERRCCHSKQGGAAGTHPVERPHGTRLGRWWAAVIEKAAGRDLRLFAAAAQPGCQIGSQPRLEAIYIIPLAKDALELVARRQDGAPAWRRRSARLRQRQDPNIVPATFPANKSVN
jgi:hypothetical protein